MQGITHTVKLTYLEHELDYMACVNVQSLKLTKDWRDMLKKHPKYRCIYQDSYLLPVAHYEIPKNVMTWFIFNFSSKVRTEKADGDQPPPMMLM